MLVELAIAPEAESDIAEACVWYEGRRPGLGDEFLSSVDACLASIVRRPDNLPNGSRGLPPLSDTPLSLRGVL